MEKRLNAIWRRRSFSRSARKISQFPQGLLAKLPKKKQAANLALLHRAAHPSVRHETRSFLFSSTSAFNRARLRSSRWLDSKGGHTDRKTGSYHTHKTPPAAAPKQQEAEPETADNPKEKSHWITSSSGIRHNAKCRYFQTSKGRLGTKDEGRPCKTCGG
jgi:hypothetical protein